MTDIEIYTTQYCGYCRRAKALLDSRGLPYREVAVDHDPALRQAMQERAGRRTVPQIFIHGRPIGGCDELFALDRSGELDKLLEHKGNA